MSAFRVAPDGRKTGPCKTSATMGERHTMSGILERGTLKGPNILRPALMFALLVCVGGALATREPLRETAGPDPVVRTVSQEIGGAALTWTQRLDRVIWGDLIDQDEAAWDQRLVRGGDRLVWGGRLV